MAFWFLLFSFCFLVFTFWFLPKGKNQKAKAKKSKPKGKNKSQKEKKFFFHNYLLVNKMNKKKQPKALPYFFRLPPQPARLAGWQADRQAG